MLSHDIQTPDEEFEKESRCPAYEPVKQKYMDLNGTKLA